MAGKTFVRESLLWTVQLVSRNNVYFCWAGLACFLLASVVGKVWSFFWGTCSAEFLQYDSTVSGALDWACCWNKRKWLQETVTTAAFRYLLAFLHLLPFSAARKEKGNNRYRHSTNFVNLPIDFILLFHTRNPALKRSRLPALQLTPAPRTSEWAPSQELSFEAPEVARQTLFSHKHPRLSKFFWLNLQVFFVGDINPNNPTVLFCYFTFLCK